MPICSLMRDKKNGKDLDKRGGGRNWKEQEKEKAQS